jgi:rhodanese-related sulfurtransferase
MKKLLLQMMGLVAVAAVAGVVSNTTRGSLAWGGSDPDLIGRDVMALSAEEAGAILDQATVLFLDVREARDFAQGRVRGALSFPTSDFEAAYAELRDFLSPDLRLVVYGDKTLFALRAAEFLEARGLHPEVMEGGWAAWKKAGLPVETGEAAP